MSIMLVYYIYGPLRTIQTPNTRKLNPKISNFYKTKFPKYIYINHTKKKEKKKKEEANTENPLQVLGFHFVKPRGPLCLDRLAWPPLHSQLRQPVLPFIH